MIRKEYSDHLDPSEEDELIKMFEKALEPDPAEFVDLDEERADYRLHSIREG